MFELYQLEQLLAVAACGTLSNAAEQLHISQPALSRSMRKLEDEIGVELFTRSKNRMELNENGRLAAELLMRLFEGETCQSQLAPWTLVQKESS